MKKLTTRLKQILCGQIKNEKGQGTAEYILLLVAVVALVVMFKDKIRAAVDSQTTSLGSSIEGFTGDSSGK